MYLYQFETVQTLGIYLHWRLGGQKVPTGTTPLCPSTVSVMIRAVSDVCCPCLDIDGQ